MNLIKKAVLPLKEQALADAQKRFEALYEEGIKILREHDMNSKQAFSENRDYWGLKEFMAQTTSQCKRRYGYYREESKREKDFHMKRMLEVTSSSFDVYVEKLNAKIGNVINAELVGSSVWSYSILKVTKEDGEAQEWKTQQITNFSKYGKFFHQWPTRRLKTLHLP